MSAGALLADLESRGVHVVAEGGSLRCRAPRGALTPADLDELRAHKAEILAELHGASDPVQASPIEPNTDPILETRQDLGAVLIRSRRFDRDVWLALSEEIAADLRTEEAERPAPRPVLLPEDVAALRGKSEAGIRVALEVAAAFPGSRIQ